MLNDNSIQQTQSDGNSSPDPFDQVSKKAMFSLIFVTSLTTSRIAEPCCILSFYKPDICWNNFSVRQTFQTNFSDNCDLENSLKFRFIKAWESLSGISRLELGGCQVSEKQSFFCIICVYLNVLVQSAPKPTSPKPQSCKNWFRLV